MANKPMNLNGSEGENHKIGRDLYKKDKQFDQDNKQQRGGYRGDETRDWGENTFFHTGPNRQGAQDYDHNDYGYRRNNNEDYPRGGASHSSYNQGQNAHLNDHYGSRSDSNYRNERSFINHGDGYSNNRNQGHNFNGNAGGSQPGNFNEPPRDRESSWRDTPGGRSRYKETDYRYGSGSHNWYRENRYSPDDDRDRNNHDDRGFFDRVKDGWNDIMHSDDPGYTDHSRNQPSNRLDRERNSSEPYRDRNFNRGYEGGPRWADETDSGHDNYYDGIDRSQRMRR
ncbi:hypothetical protein ACFSKU_20895 [Pontibacter silvestris]|uniref:Uncharacterized protein n=1 Tax=Pontibacter silvestris TaxID=2305183 RepID=A0ABW4X2Y8_9BACT|nr:hypothetical protein [Pontibacter silvestris]MCC9137161.1 hypothetical protein [Pontibacter silvestris]